MSPNLRDVFVDLIRHADAVIDLPTWPNYRYSVAGISPDGGIWIVVHDEATGTALAHAWDLNETERRNRRPWFRSTHRRSPRPERHDVIWAGRRHGVRLTLHATWSTRRKETHR